MHIKLVKKIAANFGCNVFLAYFLLVKANVIRNVERIMEPTPLCKMEMSLNYSSYWFVAQQVMFEGFIKQPTKVIK
jgi:hypothetical protein